MRANLLGFRFLLRLRVSITMQLQQCYGMPLRRRAATATATATALQYVTPSGSQQKIYCSPKFTRRCMHRRKPFYCNFQPG